MSKKLIISKPKRPLIPEDYNISEEEEGIATWEDVNRWMEESKNYWLSTTKSDNKPHSRPIWGIWIDNYFYFGGGATTKTVRNLLERNNISVHTESAENVVIIEGYTERFDDDKLNHILGLEYEKRYDVFHPPPFWRVVPEVVYAWSMDDYAKTPAKFHCKLK